MKKIIVTVLFGGLLLGQVGQVSASHGSVTHSTAPVFTDVTVDSPYYAALNYLKTEGVISGYPDGSFKPDKTINRGEFVKLIVGAVGYDVSTAPSGFDLYSATGINFSDVQDGAWYNPYLRKAVELAVIGGYSDGTFRPTLEINFAEASKIIVVSTSGDIADAGYASDDWYHKYVNVLEQKHAIPTTILNFNSKITRGETAEILYRLKRQIVNQPSLGYADLAAS
jgi:hypothetical protein